MVSMEKLYDLVEPGSDEHEAIVHAYYHILRAERGVRAAEGIEEMYGLNEYVMWWRQYAVDHFTSFVQQISRIPEWQQYIDDRIGLHADRRQRMMYRDVNDTVRKSYPKAEAAAKRARRKLKARYN